MSAGGFDRMAEWSRLTDAVFVDDEHRYLSTHCLHAILDNDHSLHARCDAEELAPGVPRRPAQCKHCGARCVCFCHY